MIAAIVGTVATLGSAAVLGGCQSREQRDQAAPTVPVELPDDAARDTARVAWPELAALPGVLAVRTITVPSRTDVPRFDVGGPILEGDLAFVSSSQFGFAAVDWRMGEVRWTKPTGSRVAPPALHGDGLALIGACLTPPEVADDHTLLGCLRVVTREGTDLAYVAVHGATRQVATFAGSVGPQRVTSDGPDGRMIRWQRGDATVAVDATTGVAVPTPTRPHPVVVEHDGRRWEITQDDGRLVARSGAKVVWQTDHEVTALLGAVWLPGQVPRIRAVNISAPDGAPELRLLDVDATDSRRAQSSTAVPGIALLGQAISPVGDVALAVRLDRSIERDFVAAYAANARLSWVYPLPMVPRADPVGVAIALDAARAPEAVVVFHDGDTLVVLPGLSSPPTAADGARAPLENTTPQVP